ncbi:MAG: HEAT repeat domain-containing protein [Ilumatobacteraceae bacterium]|nr:HEAT repeat domain-containing protein [Ilumatobacteraceae bacterium]
MTVPRQEIGRRREIGRWREIAIAGHTGDVDTARGALADDDPVSRELALGALVRLGMLTDDDLRTALVDEAPSVRRRAAMMAGRRPSVSLRALLDDLEATVVEAAAWACGEQESVDDDVLSVLIDLGVSSTDPLVREACTAALGAIGDPRGLATILHGCSDKPAVRRRAVLALAPFDGEEVDAALQAALTDRDWQVRQAAEDVLRAANG